MIFAWSRSRAEAGLGMPTWDDVRRIALALPETSERLSRDYASGG